MRSVIFNGNLISGSILLPFLVIAGMALSGCSGDDRHLDHRPHDHDPPISISGNEASHELELSPDFEWLYGDWGLTDPTTDAEIREIHINHDEVWLDARGGLDRSGPEGRRVGMHAREEGAERERMSCDYRIRARRVAIQPDPSGTAPALYLLHERLIAWDALGTGRGEHARACRERIESINAERRRDDRPFKVGEIDRAGDGSLLLLDRSGNWVSYQRL